MDALVKKAIEALVRKTLPELKELLSLCLHSGLPLDDTDLLYALGECQELLSLLSQSGLKNSDSSPSLIQDSASPLECKREDAIKSANSTSIACNNSDSEELAQDVTKNGESELSDEEAYALLAEMDSTAGLAQASAPLSADEMDDAEAIRLLQEMDAPATPTLALSTLSSKPTPGSGSSHEANSNVDEEEDTQALGEIAEWEANEFQSDPSMLSDFIVNTDELMQILDSTILLLEQDPSNKGIIEEIFRAAHTLKGAAGMFGFKAVERVMHRMENLFDLIRKERLAVESRTIDVVFQGLDLLRTLLEAIKNGAPCGIATMPTVKALSLAANGIYESKAPNTPAPSRESAATPALTPASPKPVKTEDGGEGKKEVKEQSTIRVDLERLDVLVNLVGELVIDRSRFASIESELRTNHPQVKFNSNFSETVQLFGRHMNEIQDIIMKVRMVPIGNVFNKFGRVVRDIARSLDKKIDLIITGEDAELDKTMVEQLGDPLIHLIRNCCDHGIEMPDVRVEKGKDPTGTVRLSASQEGNHIFVKIIDDGKGIDPAVIRRKAVEKGIISEDMKMSDRDSLNLIFEAGFSTAEKVTNLSGRGVGMDVVKRQIMKLKGSIDLESKPGQGMTVTIRLPLTLAIVQSLLVRVKGETFAIPLNSVIESIRITPGEIQKVGDTDVFKLRDTVLPLVQLADVMGLAERTEVPTQRSRRRSERTDRVFVVVVGHPEHPTGIIVDQLLNQQEMVIKPLGPLMKNIPCVSGGAVLGQGEVVLVLDVPEIESMGRGRNRLQVA
jgi:two-component system chemotaxis sensor kinase CheA